MRLRRASCLPALALILLSTLLHPLSNFAQSTAFTYQGFLTENGGPVSGPAEIQFTLWDTASAGTQIAATTPTVTVVGVTNGLFTVPLDFGAGAFNGAARFLQMEVRTGLTPFTLVSPRQPVTAAPYAVHALTVASNGLSGGIYSSAVDFNNTGNTFSGAFTGAMTGNGAGLSNVNAATIGGLAAANIWRLGGNAGANPATGTFLGTTDNLPLELRVNGVRALRVEPNTNGSPNLVGGFSGNSVGAGTEGAVIAGGGMPGSRNWIGVNSHYSAIGGGEGNGIWDNSSHATIAGGRANDIGVNSGRSAIGGGLENNIASGSTYATIAGGDSNDIGVNSGRSAIGGGYANTIASDAFWATIAGGYDNYIGVNSRGSAIGGGGANTIASDASLATIAGGYNNDIGINSVFSMIPGGHNNAVGANAGYAFAAGYRAKANHYGSFIWADFTEADFATTRANQFAIRAGGGVRVEGGTDAEPGSGGFLTLGSTSAVNLVLDNNEIMARNNGATATLSLNFDGGAVVTGGSLGVGRAPAVNALEVEGNASKTASGSWLANSDARIKQEVQPVTSALDTLGKVRLVSFRYTDDYLAQHRTIEDRRYLNVIAQEFAQVFPEHVKSSGEKLPDGSDILQVDIHPLTIYSAAAIQELSRKLEQKETEITDLKTRLAKLEQLVNQKLNGGAQ